MTVQTKPFKLYLTVPALNVINAFMSKRDKVKMLRIGVRGGTGCHGFKYFIECAEHFSPTKDNYLLYNDLYVIIDKKSMPFIDGATLFWKETPTEKGLGFKNPNASSLCKCKKSFSVDNK